MNKKSSFYRPTEKRQGDPTFDGTPISQGWSKALLVIPWLSLHFLAQCSIQMLVGLWTSRKYNRKSLAPTASLHQSIRSALSLSERDGPPLSLPRRRGTW